MESAAQAKEGKGDLPPELAHITDVDALVEHADGFAEVFPEHKSRLSTSSRAAATLWA